MSDHAAAVAALLDKQEITELLTRYLRSVDRGDVATLRACYLPGATEDHGGLFAGTAQDYVDSIAAGLTHPRARTSDNMTNLLIELDGDAATAESYCITFARIKAAGEYYHSFVGARMIDRLERRDGDPRTWASRTASSSGTGITTPPPPSTGCRACSPPTHRCCGSAPSSPPIRSAPPADHRTHPPRSAQEILSRTTRAARHDVRFPEPGAIWAVSATPRLPMNVTLYPKESLECHIH